jgi:hypothetical protein
MVDVAEPESRKRRASGTIAAVVATLASVATAIAAYGQWLAPRPVDTQRTSPDTAHPFIIQSGWSGKCLDDYAFNTEEGASLVQYTCNSLRNQEWYWTIDSSIRNAFSGKCMDAFSFGTVDGTSVVQWTCNGRANQHWSVQFDSHGYSVLKSQYSGKCLDDLAFGKEDGHRVVIWQCNDLSNQVWLISPGLATTS